MDSTQLEKHQLTCSYLNELPFIASELLQYAQPAKVWLFVGELGAGKTTLIKEVCHQLGVIDEVASPSFSIINEYATELDTVYHFDFYRIEDVSEARDIGVEEYFFSDSYCFVEWPQKIEELLPDKLMVVNIEIDEEKRVYNLTKYE